MARNRIIAGIELGSSKIATVVAQVQTDPTTFELKISIVGVSSVEARGIRKGQIVNSMILINSIVYACHQQGSNPPKKEEDSQ